MLNRRLSADERRRQLVGIGLRMLTERPIHELALDEVAAEAGISRGLLFHYFPTKNDFYVAVVRAAARRLVRQTTPDPDAAPADQLVQSLDAFVTFLERRREPYLALLRGSAGADYVVEIYEGTREIFLSRVRALLGPSPLSPGVDLMVRGWFSFMEETALTWVKDRPTAREELLRRLTGALPALIALADPAQAAELRTLSPFAAL